MISVSNSYSPKDVYRELLRENPEAMIVIGFETAYIGMTVTHPVIAIYDYEECIRSLSNDRNCDDEEAEEELMEIIAGCLSPEAPVFVRCK